MPPYTFLFTTDKGKTYRLPNTEIHPRTTYEDAFDAANSFIEINKIPVLMDFPTIIIVDIGGDSKLERMIRKRSKKK